MSPYIQKYNETLHEDSSLLKKKIMPINRYQCSLKLGCPLPEYICQNNGFCFPREPEDADCHGHKHLFVRINDVYTFFCNIPDNIEKQVDGPQECEKWEKYHDGICYFSGVQEETPDSLEPFIWVIFIGIVAVVLFFVYKKNSTTETDANERLPINSSAANYA